MKILVSGFNGFSQWPLNNEFIDNFTQIDLCTHFKRENINDLRCALDWCYNAFIIDGDFYICGFLNDKEKIHMKIIQHPESIRFNDLCANSKYILLYNRSNCTVWKYNLFKCDDEEQWQKLPDFMNTENQIDIDIEMKELQDEQFISKIASGFTMNICLTSQGRLFNIPTEISTSDIEGKILDVQCGYEHAVLLTDQGKVYTWGGGSRCQLGHGTIDNADHPRIVEALAGIAVVKIAAGGWHTCAISTFGDLYTWGWNDQGQLGICTSAPVQNNIRANKNQIDDSKNILSESLFKDNEFFDPVAMGSTSNLKRTASNENISKIKKMKTNCDTDIESYNSYAIPHLIDIFDSMCERVLEYNVMDVSCGSKHTVITLDDWTVLGSGSNVYGQLGFNPNVHKNIKRFTPLSVNFNYDKLNCGIWTTSLLQTK